MTLHLRFLFNKPMRRSLTLIALVLIAGLLVTSGIGDSAMEKDLVAIRYPAHYWNDGWRIVRILTALIAILLSSSLYSRQANRYSVYLITRDYRKARFVKERIATLILALSIIYAFALAVFLWIGILFVVRFELSDMALRRFGYGWLLLMMLANYEGIFHVWLDSPFATLPAIGLLMLSIEARTTAVISSSMFWSILYRMVPAELGSVDEVALYETSEWYGLLCAAMIGLIGLMFWWRDG